MFLKCFDFNNMSLRGKLNSILDKIVDFYLENYRKMVLIPIIFIIIFGSVILIYFNAHGVLVNEDISLRGGISATINTNQTINVNSISNEISNAFPGAQVAVSTLYAPFTSKIDGYSIEINKNVNITKFTDLLSSILGMKLNSNNLSIDFVSPVLATSAVYDAIILLIIAFLLVAFVSIIYFRNPTQTFSNVISIISDIINVVGVMDLLNIPFSTASIAGILMLMGYSADRNIILATNILKRKEGTIKYRLLHTIKTSLTMDAAAFFTFLVLFLGTNNVIIHNIATILIIGLLFDDFTVWILNGSIQLYGIKYKHVKEMKV